MSEKMCNKREERPFVQQGGTNQGEGEETFNDGTINGEQCKKHVSSSKI